MSSHNRIMVVKTWEKNWMLHRFSYVDQYGDWQEFYPNRVYKTGDETNSWYKFYLAELPFKAHWMKSYMVSPYLRNLPLSFVVLNMDPDHNWCLIGEPCRKKAWLFQKGRTKELDPSVIKENIEALRKNGYKFKDSDLIHLPYSVGYKEWEPPTEREDSTAYFVDEIVVKREFKRIS